MELKFSTELLTSVRRQKGRLLGSPVGDREGIRHFPYPPAIVGEEVGTQGPETLVRYIVPDPPARYHMG